jgi:hypothetical protein
MSFENERSYGRHILKPLSPPTSADILKGQHEYLRQPSTTSGSWRSTTHYFVGTAHRAEPTSWPLKRFSDDPANIPDGDYDVPYNPATAKAKSPNNKEDVFRLYQLDDPQDNNDTVPCPRIVVKRYLPTTGSEAPQGVSKITLLLLPGMGLPKEVRLSARSDLRVDFSSYSVHRYLSRRSTSYYPCSNSRIYMCRKYGPWTFQCAAKQPF